MEKGMPLLSREFAGPWFPWNISGISASGGGVDCMDAVFRIVLVWYRFCGSREPGTLRIE